MAQEPLPAMLLRLRKERGLTQKQLADLIQRRENDVQRWERGQNVPDPRGLDQLAAGLSVPVADLLSAAVRAGQQSARRDKRQRP